MATRKTGLGRGLEALLGGRGGEPSSLHAGDAGGNGRRRPAPHRRSASCSPGKYQPRTAIDVDRLTELAESIKAQGVIQPIVAREIGARQVRDHRRRAPLARGACRPASTTCRWCCATSTTAR